MAAVGFCGRRRCAGHCRAEVTSGPRQRRLRAKREGTEDTSLEAGGEVVVAWG